MTGLLLPAVYVLAGYPIGKRLFMEKQAVKRKALVLWAVLFGAFLFRIILALCITGFETDVNTFKAWGSIVRSQGLSNVYYDENLFLDYPPGYLYVLVALDWLRGVFGLAAGSTAYTLMIKVPSIVADLVTGWLLYRWAAPHRGEKAGLFFMALYLFCPAVWLNSAVWGQVDGFCLMVGIWALLLLLDEKYLLCGVVYGVALLLKPQQIFLLPIFVFFVAKKRSLKGLGLGFLGAMGALLLLAFPFVRGLDYGTLLAQYVETVNNYAYYTVNAFNLYGMLGLNWQSLDGLAGWARAALSYGPALVLTAGGWLMYRRAKSPEALFGVASLIFSGVFTFSIMMHERYLFPALLLWLMSCVVTGDRRQWAHFLLMAGVHGANVWFVLAYQNIYVEPFSPIIVGLSVLQVLLFIGQVFLCIDLFVRNHRVISTAQKSISQDSWFFEREEPRLKKKDGVIMLLITGVYALVAFWNLGSTSMPVTCWTPQQGEVVVLRLDAPADTLRYLPGLTVPVVGESSVIGVDCTVSVSVDGLSWGEEVPLTGDAVYTWQEIPYNGSFSYVKLTCGHAPVVLAEMAFFDEQGKYVSYTVERSGETSEALHDEASEVPENPTWYDSMYFDEIYHARSAYEYLLGAEPYENTHPPLGKWIMAIGIMWFGMNPFGWRFMGALFGVLMLPLLYHMTKRLTRSSGGAFLATFLFAFDFMHITQTRMATIDTYAVFFTLVMFDGMLCFLQKDLLRMPVSRLLRPLAVSGLGVGLGAAAKWNTLYGAVGLAVLFFWRILSCRRNLEQQWQKKYLTRQTVRLITGCLGCFILLPALCYWLAFLPQICLPGHSLGDFWGYQTSMYDYHSSLQATHAFSSSWWQWPLMERPVWYHVTYAPGGQEGTLCTIAGMGSPLLWWGGLAALLYTLVRAVRRRRGAACFILVGYGACYVPWMLVSRLTFLYHYFPCVPFLAMAVAFWYTKTFETAGKKPCRLLFPHSSHRFWQKVTLGDGIITGLCIISVGFVILFWPVITGVPVSSSYIHWLQWLPGWFFGG